MKTVCFRLIGLLLLPFCLCFGTTAPAKAQDANLDIYGKWRVTRDVSPEGTITGRNARQLRAIMGKVAEISPDRFVFNGSNCSRPKYTRSSDDTATYFYREWRVNSDEMPLGDRVTIIEVDCDIHFLYPIDKNRLIIADDGDFFEAVRIGSEAAPKPATAGTKAQNLDIFGTWTVDGVTWDKGQALSQKQAKMLMGMPVYISASRFFYNENTCKQPTYKRSKQDKTAYFHGDWRANPAKLPLPKMLTVIETDCGTIYPISRKRILIEDKNGLFFSAVPLSGQNKSNG